VVGGGPAGLMAAGTAANQGSKVILLEKMPRLGRKLLLTGKGRCNITNTAPMPEFIENFPGNGAFLYGPMAAFSNQDLLRFLAELGLATKEERGRRVFPESDRSVDVLRALERFVNKAGVLVRTGHQVTGLIQERMAVHGKEKLIVPDHDNLAVSNNESNKNLAAPEAEAGRRLIGVATTKGDFYGDAVIIATGGLSYPATGSTGDGYAWARALGHTVIPPRPGLVPLEVREEWVKEVQGLSLRNVRVTARAGGGSPPANASKSRLLGEEFGEMLFTHFGVSGPVILSLSSPIAKHLLVKRDTAKPGAKTKPAAEVTLSINLKPALSLEQLDQRIQRDLSLNSRKQFRNSLDALLPRALIPVIVELSQIPGDKFSNQITREERTRLALLLTELPLTVTRTRPIEEAIITAGGIAVKEINPRTMASRLIEGLYFAGEVIDVDGYTGGFNLQAAFSTGYVAGRAAGTP
jgi:predicted Rossmann fold flavoprotein